jgi:hypothetical protein
MRNQRIDHIRQCLKVKGRAEALRLLDRTASQTRMLNRIAKTSHDCVA